MANYRNNEINSDTFTRQELNFFKRMNPRTDQPIRLAEAPSRPPEGLEPTHRSWNPTYLVALVGFAGILFFITSAI